MSDSVLCIGIGNEFRHDDGIGIEVAHVLLTMKLPHVRVIEQTGEGAALMDAWAGAERVILVDAALSGQPPGTIYRINAHEQQIPRDFFSYTTHAFSVAEAIEMARTLNQLPPTLIVYGIEGKDFSEGIGLSRVVEEAVQQVLEQIVGEIYATTPE
ncbi:MAG: hydrogenase maturation protease [Anaerolineae bacterium]|nr:hydrogenase maturation protease [Anaerolineae bacterium]